jgi:hypothetical protein
MLCPQYSREWLGQASGSNVVSISLILVSAHVAHMNVLGSPGLPGLWPMGLMLDLCVTIYIFIYIKTVEILSTTC